jgi:HD-GYP domain-containing protein (c-di-GMP phosphodiesterase class II)
MRLSLHAIEGHYPSNQGLRSAMLAASIGGSMGYDQQTLQRLIIGCLLHDAGMQSLREISVASSRVFSSRDFSEIAAHPLHTFELVGRELDTVAPETRMVAYQMHERCDGQGYPRGRSAKRIHPLAKIAAVADAFVALVSPRPHRDGLMPYYAIEHIIRDTRAGQFDPAVTRGLLRSVSLFPVGSSIAIGGEMVGKVVRTNPELYDRPMVEIRLRSKPKADPVVVDLSSYGKLPIRPISPEAELTFGA